jgi:nitroimidazol reductase NimA-like FMN-containing flavoprotein (pyridoxamine 5'-phosphate oxidase superfamily)
VVGRRVLRELPEAESLRLLASVSLGRVVFSHHALPAVRPVNHLVDGGDVIIRTHLGSAVTGAARDGVVVAYEADDIDPDSHRGWSVVAVGMARVVTDPDQVRHYERALRPWIAQRMDFVIRIRPELITGYRLDDA